MSETKVTTTKLIEEIQSQVNVLRDLAKLWGLSVDDAAKLAKIREAFSAITVHDGHVEITTAEATLPDGYYKGVKLRGHDYDDEAQAHNSTAESVSTGNLTDEDTVVTLPAGYYGADIKFSVYNKAVYDALSAI